MDRFLVIYFLYTVDAITIDKIFQFQVDLQDTVIYLTIC